MTPRAYPRLRCQSGQTMTEYAVVLGVISIIVIAAFTSLSSGISSTITHAASFL